MSALYFMTIVAVLAVAVLHTARQWTRSERRATHDAALTNALEQVLVSVVSDWSSREREEQTVGSTTPVATALPGGSDLYRTAHITRLTRTVYWIQAEARGAGSFAARHRATLLVRMPEWQPPSRSPLLSAGDVVLGVNAQILMDGGDGAGCLDGAGTAVALAPGARLQLAGGYPEASRPASRVDSTAMDPLSALAAAGTPWQALVRDADITLPAGARLTPLPVVEADRCADTANNWGEPLRQGTPSVCEGRRPVIYAAGDLTLSAGRAQGVLLVEGRLRLAGPLILSGLVIARGGIETIGDGVTISGIVISGATNSARPDGESGDPTPVSLRHSTTLRFSPCDARHVMTSTKRVQVVRERAWAELF